jgi:hypothetical protein
MPRAIKTMYFHNHLKQWQYIFKQNKQSSKEQIGRKKYQLKILEVTNIESNAVFFW